jgi:UDP-N-acetyl-D-glucosamine dehydrogenase
VTYHDPCIPHIEFGGTRHLHERVGLDSVELTADALQAADCVVIVTHHADLDIATIVAHSRIVVDTVNATRGTAGPARIVRLGAPSARPATAHA